MSDTYLATLRWYMKTLSLALLLAATAHLVLIVWRSITLVLGPVIPFTWDVVWFFGLHYVLNAMLWGVAASAVGKGSGVKPMTESTMYGAYPK